MFTLLSLSVSMMKISSYPHSQTADEDADADIACLTKADADADEGISCTVNADEDADADF